LARPQVLAAVSAPWPNQPAAAVSSTQTLGKYVLDKQGVNDENSVIPEQEHG
jgi:hypothetical protein